MTSVGCCPPLVLLSVALILCLHAEQSYGQAVPYGQHVAYGQAVLKPPVRRKYFLGKRSALSTSPYDARVEMADNRGDDTGRILLALLDDELDNDTEGYQQVMRNDDAVEKRAYRKNFLGKRAKNFLGKRGFQKNFLGKRAYTKNFLGKRAAFQKNFLGKRSQAYDYDD